MRTSFALLAAALPGMTIAQVPAKPLFASDAPIRVTIQGPVNSIARKAADSVKPEAATLSMASPAETHPIQLSARGLSRRTAGICDFPPLRVQFTQPPAAASLFSGQKRLKLVTHCNSSPSHQQYLLLEYAAYPIMNVLTPLSYKARLATVDYADSSGKVSTTRWGFFIEDIDDVAKRNGVSEARVGDRILTSQLEPIHSARVALFQYMIGNLDWSMRAGPPGEGCCHNSRLMNGPGGLMPVPYDFDYSGFVNAPYAVPPEGIKVRSVRDRAYRGHCRHNAQALTVAAEMRAKRGAIEGVVNQLPGLEGRTRSRALAYLSSFFDEIATDQSVQAKLLKDCIA